MYAFEDYDGAVVKLYAKDKWFEGFLRVDGELDYGFLEACGIRRYLTRWCNLYTTEGIMRFEFDEIKEIQFSE